MWPSSVSPSLRSIQLLCSPSIYLFIYLDFFKKLLFVERGEGREKERKRNISVWLCLVCPCQGPGSQPRHVPWLGIEPVTLWFTGLCSINSLSHTSQTGGFIFYFIFFKILFIYLFLERGEERENERDRNICVWLALTNSAPGDLAHNPGMCPDWESNQWPFLVHRPTSVHSATPARAGGFIFDWE